MSLFEYIVYHLHFHIKHFCLIFYCYYCFYENVILHWCLTKTCAVLAGMEIALCILTFRVTVVFSFIAQKQLVSFFRYQEKSCLLCTCAEATSVLAQTICLAILSFHTGGPGWVHYFDCHLTICLYDRQPWSLAIDGRETHRFITQRPLVAFKSGSVHRQTRWVLLSRGLGYWLRGS